MKHVTALAVMLAVVAVASEARAVVPGGIWRWLGAGWGDGYHATPCHPYGHGCAACGHHGFAATPGHYGAPHRAYVPHAPYPQMMPGPPRHPQPAGPQGEQLLPPPPVPNSGQRGNFPSAASGVSYQAYRP